MIFFDIRINFYAESDGDPFFIYTSYRYRKYLSINRRLQHLNSQNFEDIKGLAVKSISVLTNSIRLKFYLEVFRILFTNRFLGLENQSGMNPNGEIRSKQKQP